MFSRPGPRPVSSCFGFSEKQWENRVASARLLRLADRHHSISGDIAQRLHVSARPADFDFGRGSLAAQAETYQRFARGSVTDARGAVIVKLPLIRQTHANRGADAVTVAARACEPQR